MATMTRAFGRPLEHWTSGWNRMATHPDRKTPRLKLGVVKVRVRGCVALECTAE